MNRDQNTGRFSKQEQQDSNTFTSTINSISLDYKMWLAILVLIYPWLVIITNNSTRIAAFFNNFNAFILQNITSDKDAFNKNSL